MAAYLAAVHAEATARGYAFDGSKIAPRRWKGKIPETTGQIAFEWEHLLRKLAKRNPEWLKADKQEEKRGGAPSVHPMFRVISGGIRDWEKV